MNPIAVAPSAAAHVVVGLAFGEFGTTSPCAAAWVGMRRGELASGDGDAMAAARTGDSAMARGFGATIDVASTFGRALFLVVGNGVSPRSAVTSADGQVVVELPDGVRLLA